MTLTKGKKNREGSCGGVISCCNRHNMKRNSNPRKWWPFNSFVRFFLHNTQNPNEEIKLAAALSIESEEFQSGGWWTNHIEAPPKHHVFLVLTLCCVSKCSLSLTSLPLFHMHPKCEASTPPISQSGQSSPQSGSEGWRSLFLTTCQSHPYGHRLFHRIPLLLMFHFVSLIVGSLCLPLMMLEHYVSCKVFYRPGSIYNGAFENPISAVLTAPWPLLQIDADCNRLQSTFAVLLLLLVSIKSRMRL